MISKMEGRASAVLRNLAHNTKQHQLLIQSGAVDALADIMRQNKVRAIPLLWSFTTPWSNAEGAHAFGSNVLGAHALCPML